MNQRVKSLILRIAEALLPTPLLTRLRFRLFGKWGDQLEGVETIAPTGGARPLIPGLLRIPVTRSPAVEECLVHVTEDSVLERPGSASLPRYMAGGRRRLATCSGVSWFRDRDLAVVNYHGRNVRIYRLEGDLSACRDLRLVLVHHQDHAFAPPEDVAVSPDARLLAVTHALPGDHMVTLHDLDPDTLEPGPIRQRLRRGTAPHGVTISPDGWYLLFTEVFTGMVQVYDISSRPAKWTQTFVAPVAPRVPKSVAVTPDCRYVAVAHAAEVALGREHLTGSRLAIHRFDSAAGRIEEEPISVREGLAAGLAGLESCAFVRGAPGGPYLLAVCDQAADLVTLFRFEPDPARVTQVLAFGGVSFPHGVSANPSGTLLAVTCYGDDTVRLFRLPGDERLSSADGRFHVLLCNDRPAGRTGVVVGDAETSEVVQSLVDQGYRVTCLLTDEQSVGSLASIADRLIQLDVPTPSPERPFDERNVARLETFIREEMVDVVQVHGIAGMAALEAGRRAGVPTVLMAGEGNEPPVNGSDDLALALLPMLRSRADVRIRWPTQRAGPTESHDGRCSPQKPGTCPEGGSDLPAGVGAIYRRMAARREARTIRSERSRG